MGASPRAVDWDEDGDFDLLSGEYAGFVTLFRNIGTPTNPILTNEGHLKMNGVDIDVGNLSVPEVNDWNEDGRKDLIMGCDAGYIYYYLNTGTNSNPAFRTSAKMADDGGQIQKIKNCPRITDLNEDGLKDLVLAWIDGTCLFWPNHGTNAAPVFHEKYELTGYTDTLDPDPGAYNWSHFGTCDWNEDGHPDLLYTRWESEIFIHLSGTYLLECTIDPVDPPVKISPHGGAVSYEINLTNNSSHDVILDVWTEITMPDGEPYGPVRIVATNETILAGGTNYYQFDDDVPGSFPPSGDYTFDVYMGNMDSGYFVTDSFTFTKNDHLAAEPLTLSEKGGSIDFGIDAEPVNAYRNYILLGGVTGTVPGQLLPGGHETIPLNFDAFTWHVVIPLLNSPIFSNFKSQLDESGQSTAQMNSPELPPGYVGLIVYFAYCLANPYDFASNAVEIEIVE